MVAKAVVGIGARQVALRDIEIGEVGDWDIRVELEASAISAGTESYTLSDTGRFPPPFVLGYAPVARIVETGDRAGSLFKEGERVSYFQPRAPENEVQRCGGHQSPVGVLP